VTQRIGDSLAKDAYFWWNAALPIDKDSEFYAFGGVSKRTGDSAGFFRSAGDGRNVPAVYPNGFLPNIRTTVKDASFAVGYRRDLANDWKFDISVNHGRSELGFHERNRSTSATGTSRNRAAASTPSRRAKPTPAS
jgi:iron complex outermembrane receptor protein